MKNDRNEQEKFWALNYSKDYIKKNSDFNQSLLLEGWAKILKNVDTPKTHFGMWSKCRAQYSSFEYHLSRSKKNGH